MYKSEGSLCQEQQESAAPLLLDAMPVSIISAPASPLHLISVTPYNSNTPLHSAVTTPFSSLAGTPMHSANVTPLPVKKFKPPDWDTGTDLLPVCRICQLPGDDDDLLFSPCRCSGSLKFVHYTCLLKWIEVSSRKLKRPPRCELCHFLYMRHKRFKFSHRRFPRVSRRDKCLHAVFFINLLIMISCAVGTILLFVCDNRHMESNGKDPVELTSAEIVTLVCGVMFFISFFSAMTAEIKAKHTIYKLFLKFIMQNTEWQIEPYDRTKDTELDSPAGTV